MMQILFINAKVTRSTDNLSSIVTRHEFLKWAYSLISLEERYSTSLGYYIHTYIYGDVVCSNIVSRNAKTLSYLSTNRREIWCFSSNTILSCIDFMRWLNRQQSERHFPKNGQSNRFLHAHISLHYSLWLRRYSPYNQSDYSQTSRAQTPWVIPQARIPPDAPRVDLDMGLLVLRPSSAIFWVGEA